MSNTNMVLGSWTRDEWPEYITVSHEGMREPGRRYVPERTRQMVGDEVRREVAARLRDPFDVIGQGRYVSLNGTLFGMQLLASSENKLRAGVRRLADLIDPSGGQNEPDVSTDSDCSTKEGHQPDTGGHCPKSRPGMSGIDRNALLALADEIAESVDYRMSRGEICAPIGIYVLRGYARRIRKALGVES